MKTILVTGAAGYIGRHVVKNALDRGYRVIAADFNFKGVDERAEFCDVPLFGGDADLYRKLGSPETIRKVKTIPPEQPAAQVEQTEVIREVREKPAGAKAQSKITGKLSSQTSRLETMLRRKNPEKRLAEKYTHEERRQAMKELDEMIATATRLREIIAKVERSADEAQEV